MKPSDLRRLLGSGHADAADARELRREMEAHVAHRVDDLVEGGMDPGEARTRALREFGDPDRLVERAVEARRSGERARGRTGTGGRGTGGANDGGRRAGRLDGLRQDAAYAVRQLRRSPGFAALAILTLTLGIAATTVILSVVRTVVLAPLPFVEPDRLVLLEEVTPSGGQFSVSAPAYLDWADQSRAFEAMGASTDRSATLQGVGEPRTVRTLVATPSLLPALGVSPLLGRHLDEAEGRPGAPAPVAILSHALWSRDFGSDPGVLGRDVVLNGQAHRIVGVLPPSLSFLDRTDLVVPLGVDPTEDRDQAYLEVWGRLAPGVELDQARREMDALAARLGEIHPVDAGWGVQLSAMRDVLVGDDLTLAGWVLLAGAVLLLAIACVNVSNLLLARAAGRRGEIGVRVAMGAGRWRIVRQLLTESLVLAAVAGAVGLALAWLALPAVQALGADRIPRLDQTTIGAVDAAACAGAALVAAVLFGLAPALNLRKAGAAAALRAGRRGSTGGRGMRSALVAGQIALSLVLLLTTALLGRSLLRLASVDPGFEAEGTLTLRVSMPDAEYDRRERPVMLQEVVDAVDAVPGVAAAGATVVEPFSGMNLMNFIARQDRMPDAGRDFLPIAWRVVTPGFDRALGLELLAGRSFGRTDGMEEEGGPRPVVVSRALVRRLWPDGGPADALGTTLVWGDPTGSRLTVVGVVEDLRDWRLTEAPHPMVFRPHREIPWTVMTVVARVEAGSPATADAVRAAFRSVAPALAVPEVRSLEADVSRAVATPRFHALLLGAFAVTGLLLAVVGVYAVTAFEVSSRVREIGIRMAIGGEPRTIRRRMLGASLSLALVGTAVGGAAAWFVGRAVASLLYDTSPRDPAAWAAVITVLLAAVAVATWLPTGRATRVQPRDVLGVE